MDQITIYKGDRKLVINNAPGALDTMKKYGWTDVQPVKLESSVPWTKPAKRGRKKQGESD